MDDSNFDEHIGQMREVLHQMGIAESLQSDDEAAESSNHTALDDDAQYTEPFDLQFSDAYSLSDLDAYDSSDSDAEEYIPAGTQIMASLEYYMRRCSSLHVAEFEPDKEAEDYSPKAMRRALAAWQATQALIKAEIQACSSLMQRAEKRMDLLRKKHTKLITNLSDANGQIDRVREALQQNGIGEFSESGDEYDGDGFPSAYRGGKGQPPRLFGPQSEEDQSEDWSEEYGSSDCGSEESFPTAYQV
ncbi:hypothetical protein HWV62_17076 [Athelia sp. TMB]|nr:hypothetical protein HWV62_17076 [Athelia sp. TMB]